MVDEQRNTETLADSDTDRARGIGIGTGLVALLFATACGVTVGMLTAPDTGRHTRRRLQKRVAAFRGDVKDRWGEVQDRWDVAQDRMADLEGRLERMTHGRTGGSSSSFGTVALGLAAGAGLAYLLTADDAAPVRSQAQKMASGLRQRATDHWQQFRHRHNQTDTAETSSPTFSDEV